MVISSSIFVLNSKFRIRDIDPYLQAVCLPLIPPTQFLPPGSRKPTILNDTKYTLLPIQNRNILQLVPIKNQQICHKALPNCPNRSSCISKLAALTVALCRV